MKKIQLEGCLNFRDFGGYPCSNGQVVASGKLYRADDLTLLTENDLACLKKLGVTCAIDLRHENETESSVHPFEETDGLNYYHVSLMDNLNSAENLADIIPQRMPDLYCSLLQNSGKDIASVFQILLQNLDTGVVFHCTAGKDRTGVVAALFLDLLGVSRRDILENYSKSYLNIKPMIDKKVAQAKMFGFNFPDEIFRSDPEFMEEMFDLLDKEYQDAEHFLLSHGLSEKEICTLRSAYQVTL